MMSEPAIMIGAAARQRMATASHLRGRGASMRRNRSGHRQFWIACALALPCTLIAFTIHQAAADTAISNPSAQKRPMPPPAVTPMRSTFYARRDGAVVRRSPAISAPVIRTLKENEPVGVIGKLVIGNADLTERIWYKLRLADGSLGFSAEDQIFGERALKEKRRFLQWIAQLDEALEKIRSQGRGRYRRLSGVWAGRCQFYYNGNLIDYRKVPRPNGGNTINDDTIAIFSSVIDFVYFEDMKIHVASGETPAEFRSGRLEYVKDVNGHALYRAKMDDGGEGFVLTLAGPQFSMDGDAALAKGPLKMQPACSRAGADIVIGKLKRLLRRRIELILAE
jgi:hypothetical protein